jgi:hypothetical protein
MINEYGAVGGMRIGKGKRSTLVGLDPEIVGLISWKILRHEQLPDLPSS